ncbi:hypothetical protein EV421DRAFT_1718777 [Armillaria borealis]|uniref:C2H2-type domain-containing protein n=1 Tax=Armillaria borealis TaxID=47425 RepID=A0AA39MGQ0_9AGAR|nr:hypothetical protein EV421DRAFT_1718777 [Armillaria borealis]
MIQCSQCDKKLRTRCGWIMHCQAMKDHNFCAECTILFSNRASLHSHKSSRAHKKSDIPCSMCSKKFKAPSEIASHIESGGCNPNINRHHVSAAIHAMHISPPITITRRIEGPINPVVNFSATDRAFNGKAYEYYLCHAEFSTLQSPNLHLNSPVHDANEFKCPKRRCGRKFKVVSAHFEHIESESCSLARFTTVQMEAMLLTGQFAQLVVG